MNSLKKYCEIFNIPEVANIQNEAQKKHKAIKTPHFLKMRVHTVLSMG